MSRFSFRAYHKNAGRYLEGGYDLSCKVGLNSFGELVSGDPAVIIEQSTGLCDCEGKEIFEGDRLLIIDHNNYDAETKTHVQWESTGFWVQFETSEADCYTLGSIMGENSVEDVTVKIIGNVHEEGNK
jgi:uncharacterized phage protein (TIGR01671 family)